MLPTAISITKRANIKKRRLCTGALQKYPKNAAAWYKLGLISWNWKPTPSLADARSSFLRVIDLPGEGEKVDIADLRDAVQKTADIDYFAVFALDEQARDSKEKLKLDDVRLLREELGKQKKWLEANFPNTFETLRIHGLAEHAALVGMPLPDCDPSTTDRPNLAELQKCREQIRRLRRPHVLAALDYFRKADALKPYDKALGFALISTLAEAGEIGDAERYANAMIARKSADSRVYKVLWEYYYTTGHPDQAEQIRKRQVENEDKPTGEAYVALASHYYLVRKPAEMQATLGKLTSDVKKYKNGFMLAGDFYMSIGDLASAIPNYQHGADLAPLTRPRLEREDDIAVYAKPEYQKKIAEGLTLQGKNDDAAKLVAELLKQDSEDPEAIAMSAALDLNRAKPEDADKIIARLQPLVAKTSSPLPQQSTILRFNLGRAYALKGDAQSLDQARLQFQEALKARGRIPYIPALLSLAQIEEQRGEYPQSAEHATEVLRIDPTNMTARLIRSSAWMNSGEFDKPTQELQAILKFRPDSKDAQYQMARLYLLQKKYAESEAGFEALKKQGDPRGIQGLTEARVRAGKIQEAISLLQSELIRSPNNANYRDVLAALLYNSGRYVESVAEFRKLIEQNQNMRVELRQAWYMRMGEAFRKLGNFGEAASAFSKAGELDPHKPTPKLELAMLYDVSGKAEEARKLYDEVLKLDPENPVALNNVAYAKADAGSDLDQALSLAKKAQAKAPQDVSINDTLGLIFLKKGLTDDSLRLFGELAAREPDNATFHLHLAMALYQKGNSVQARRELESARKGRPTDREQSQIKELLAKIG